MARARNIKPGFFMNEDLTEIAFEYRLLFIGLWTLADREGKLEDRPKRIKMELFPADNVDVDHGLSELERFGFVERYEVDGLRIVMVTKFADHQRPHHTERASQLPNKDGSMPVAEPKKQRPATNSKPKSNGEVTVKGALKDGGNPPDSPNPDSLIPDSLNPEREDGPPAARPDPTPKKTTASRATRLPESWRLPKAWRDWALAERPDWTAVHVDTVAASFHDYWISKGGADARKVNWEATWRNWVRREKQMAPRNNVTHLNRQEALEAKNRQVAESWAARMQGGAL